MSVYDQWLAGLSPPKRRATSRPLCSALCTRLLAADMEIEVELGPDLYMMPMVPRVL